MSILAIGDQIFFYPAHYHEAEELYFVISGKAIFAADGTAPKELGPNPSDISRKLATALDDHRCQCGF